MLRRSRAARLVSDGSRRLRRAGSHVRAGLRGFLIRRASARIPGPSSFGFHIQAGDLMQVFVRDNDVNGALRILKKKMQREGTFREMKRRRSYEKPSERRVREKAEAVRRHRKALRKRLEREGY